MIGDEVEHRHPAEMAHQGDRRVMSVADLAHAGIAGNCAADPTLLKAITAPAKGVVRSPTQPITCLPAQTRPSEQWRDEVSMNKPKTAPLPHGNPPKAQQDRSVIRLLRKAPGSQTCTPAFNMHQA